MPAVNLARPGRRAARSVTAARALVAAFSLGVGAGHAQTTPLGATGAADDRRSLPGEIPIFPLPDVTLFPHTSAPFHIFEPRYRAMVSDVLAADSIIGMVMLQPGFEADYEGRPPIHAIGCAGKIVAAERLADGRYDIVLRGFAKFRILAEDGGRAYRVARVEELPDAVSERDRPLLAQRRRLLEAAVLARYPRAGRPPPELSDEEVVDALALVVPLASGVRLELLEANGPLERASALLRLVGTGRQALNRGVTGRSGFDRASSADRRAGSS